MIGDAYIYNLLYFLDEELQRLAQRWESFATPQHQKKSLKTSVVADNFLDGPMTIFMILDQSYS